MKRLITERQEQIYRGVRRKGNRYTARYGKRALSLGSFSTPEQAARVYDTHVRKLHGMFAPVNFGEYIKCTLFQYICYRYVAPQFGNKTITETAAILNKSVATICKALKRMEQSIPSLFPIIRYVKGRGAQNIRYQSWMDYEVIQKF